MRTSLFCLVITILLCSQGRAADVPQPIRDSASIMRHITLGATLCSTSGATLVKETKAKNGWRVWVPVVLPF